MWDSKRKAWKFVIASALTVVFLTFQLPSFRHYRGYATAIAVPPQCLSLRASLEPSPAFIASRTVVGSDRYVEGTPPVLIHNAKILTGARNGTEVVFGDVLLDNGLVVAVGYIPHALTLLPNLQVIDAGGKWISPGIVDAHSHLGVYSAPALQGVYAFELLRVDSYLPFHRRFGRELNQSSDPTVASQHRWTQHSR